MSQTLATRFDHLQDLCIARLRDCVDPRTGRFGRQIRDGAWAATQGTESLTSSAICLIGLSRAGIPADAVVPDAAGLCRQLAVRVRQEAYPGGFGLVLWAGSALRAGGPLALLAEAGFEPSTLRLALPTLTSMETAWLASGLLHADLPCLRPTTDAALAELTRRLNPAVMVFRHAAVEARLAHRLRARIANFADQVYPLQALAFAAIARGDAAWRDLADRLAMAMVQRQGPLGQWWWHHDAVTGAVAERYPVYSVHQHSMGPMALRALAVAGGRSHTAAATASRAWLQANELGLDMAEPGSGVIWRSVERDETRLARRARHACALLAKPTAEPDWPLFRLNREIRPYEWGWLLYASAIEGSPPPAGHIV
ncbi:hypothetical protein [Paracraurococcus ruber]|uniref:Uncharacterized protein n=1 Tax=Paracraurococcus ruber TaxID=77675 RepID=A0ABS1CU24_9PROT|nr:hypothetical protein [Paracraurococcus ruber]MBK1657334.1 hypothetical protein [Paracraurococcus ruber]TDG34004.1 hypothetical protein E2C05_01830 [Paracraurococcus ruber]